MDAGKVDDVTLYDALANVPLFRRGEITKNKEEQIGMKPIWTFDDDDLDTLGAWADGRDLEWLEYDDETTVEITEPTVNNVMGEEIAKLLILQNEDPARCVFRFDLFGTPYDDAVRVESSDLNEVLARAGEKLDERMKRRLDAKNKIGNKEIAMNIFYELDDQELSDIDKWVEAHGMVWRKDTTPYARVVISRLPKPGHFKLHDVCALHTGKAADGDKAIVVGRVSQRGDTESVFDVPDVKQALAMLDELLEQED